MPTSGFDGLEQNFYVNQCETQLQQLGIQRNETTAMDY